MYCGADKGCYGRNLPGNFVLVSLARLQKSATTRNHIFLPNRPTAPPQVSPIYHFENPVGVAAPPITRGVSPASETRSMASPSEIVLNVPPFFRMYKDGTVERLMGTETVPVSDDGSVASRDVTLDADTGVFVRLYLPRMENPGTRVPVVLYVHGGGFCIESAASPTYHNYLNKMAREARVICVSVDYRRVPEHRLPAAYDDCFGALEWLRRQAEGTEETLDPWLRSHADFSNCYLAGDSAGANIVHNLGIRAGMNWNGSDCGLSIRGAILVHPFFAAEEQIGSERSPEAGAFHKSRDALWNVCLPEGEDADYFGFNPIGPRSPSLSALIYPRTLVIVAGNDFIKDRGIWYYEILKNAGKHVELLMTEGEFHVFHLKDLECENARLMMKRISDFIHSQNV